MPSIGNPFVKGNLYILFRVTFPEDGAFTPEQLKVLKEILPDPDMECDYEDDVEEVNMDSADLRQFGKGGAHGSNESAYDSDSDDGPQQVQCQQS